MHSRACGCVCVSIHSYIGGHPPSHRILHHPCRPKSCHRALIISPNPTFSKQTLQGLCLLSCILLCVICLGVRSSWSSCTCAPAPLFCVQHIFKAPCCPICYLMLVGHVQTMFMHVVVLMATSMGVPELMIMLVPSRHENASLRRQSNRGLLVSLHSVHCT